jgi:hypothetical protein
MDGPSAEADAGSSPEMDAANERVALAGKTEAYTREGITRLQS